MKLVTPPAPMESKTIPSALNGYWITYTEYYTDRYWDQHPSQGLTDGLLIFLIKTLQKFCIMRSMDSLKRQNMSMYSKNLATTIEIDHRQRETIFRTAVQHNGKKLSTIQKSFPHGQWVDYDCDSMISGMKSKAGFPKKIRVLGQFEQLFENRRKLEIIGPNHLRIETVKIQTQPFHPQYDVSKMHPRCGGELLYSDIPGILKQTQKGIPNSHGYDHRGISYNRLGQPNFGNYPQNYSSCGCTPKLTKGTHGVTFGIPGKDFKRVQWTDCRSWTLCPQSSPLERKIEISERCLSRGMPRAHATSARWCAWL